MLETLDDIAATIETVTLNLTDQLAIRSGMTGLNEIDDRFEKGIVWVTDLLNPKRAYFKLKYPELAKEVPIERRELMWAGTDFHEEFGRAVVPSMYREQFVAFESIIGRIDIFKDHPVEVKRTKELSPSSDIVKERPDNVEQLGMYCAMTRVDWGRLVFYIYKGDEPGNVLVFDLKFDDINGMRDVMRARKGLILRAWAESDPSILPACPWFGRSCECQGTCDCSTSKPFGHEIARMATKCEFDPDESKRLTRLLNAYISVPRTNVSYWDVLFPRRYWFKKTVVKNADPSEENVDAQASSERRAWRNTVNGIEKQIKHNSGIDYVREYIEVGDEKMPVEFLRKAPTVISHSNLRDPLPSDTYKIAKWLKDDVLRAGMQCALTDKKTGKIVAYYRNVDDPESKVVVYMVEFKDTKPYLEFIQERLGGLKSAVEGKDLSALPRCPEFKCEYKGRMCPYIGECGK